MQKENSSTMLVYFLIVVLVVGGLVYMSVNKKGNSEDGNNMTNTPNTQSTTQIEGVKITVLKEGSGEEAKSGNTVSMNYTGRLTNGTVFDSNVDPKFQHVEPFVFTLGVGQVIKGWDIGVAGMKAGEKRILEIQPDYGYGASGAGGVIPPNATLTFEVELVAIKN